MARILSIEDDSDIQHLIGQVLFKAGYEVDYAWNGQEGYEKVLSRKPDLILLDLMLPIMNGIQLLNKLKENKATRAVPIIIVTGFGDEADLLRNSVEVLGAAAYLSKPIQVRELVSAVRRVLALFLPASDSSSPAQRKELRKGLIRADPKFMTLWINDRLLATLPNKEFALLRCLMEASGPVSKDALLRGMGYEPHQGDALKQAVHRLREALGASESRRLKAVFGGYELLG